MLARSVSSLYLLSFFNVSVSLCYLRSSLLYSLYSHPILTLPYPTRRCSPAKVVQISRICEVYIP